MNLRFTFSLLFLFIVIGGLVAVTQVLRTSDEIETRERLYRISSSELVQLDIKSKQNEITFEKKDDDVGNQDTLNAEQVMAFAQFRHENMIMDSGMDPLSIEALEDETWWKTEINYPS